jgi:hypothetical protein
MKRQERLAHNTAECFCTKELGLMSKKKNRDKSWRSLQYIEGQASQIPRLFTRVVTSEPAMDRFDAYNNLRRSLVGDEYFCTAAPRAINELVSSLADSKEPRLLLRLVADILGADMGRAWALGPIFERDEIGQETLQVALDHADTLLAWLANDRASATAQACTVAAMLPSLADQSLPILCDLATHHENPVVRASALLALAGLEHGDAEIVQLIETARSEREAPIVRGAAGLAWLRQDPSRTLDDAREELKAWLEFSSTDPLEMPWFSTARWFDDRYAATSVFMGLVHVANQRGERGISELLELVLELGEEARLPASEHLSKVVLYLGGFLRATSFPSIGPILPADELTPPQRQVAEKFAHSRLVPEGGFGLAPCGRVRHRWLGIEPPSPLERYVDFTSIHKSSPGDSSHSIPLWRAWQQAHLEGRTQEVLAHLSGFDRYRALVLFGAGLYYTAPVLKPEEIESELEMVIDLPGLQDVAEELVKDLLTTVSVAYERGAIRARSTSSALLFLPMIRRGETIPPDWDMLVYAGKSYFDKEPDPHAVEILQAHPIERRESIITTFLNPEAAGGGYLHLVMPMLYLAPTPKMDAMIHGLIDKMESPFAKEGYKKDLAEMIAQHPELGSWT